jgi:hypothetical protein
MRSNLVSIGVRATSLLDIAVQISLFGIGMIAAQLAVAGTTGGGDLAPCTGKPLFIAPMPQNFQQYLTAEILAQGVRIDVSTDENEVAKCVMRGDVRLDSFVSHGGLGSAAVGSATVHVDGADGKVIWSATSGDKDSVKDLAHNIVKQLKHDLQNPRKK